MTTLNAKQKAALEMVQAAGESGFRNWDSVASRRPIHAAVINGMESRGLVAIRVLAPGSMVYVLTAEGRATLVSP